MEYLIGVGLAVVVCAFATLVGFDRDRVFYPTLVTVIATYYILFGSSTPALALESLIAGAFLALAVAGFKKNLWLIVAALAGQGVFDFFHHLLIQLLTHAGIADSAAQMSCMDFSEEARVVGDRTRPRTTSPVESWRRSRPPNPVAGSADWVNHSA
jgi:hypothetical protein